MLLLCVFWTARSLDHLLHPRLVDLPSQPPGRCDRWPSYGDPSALGPFATRVDLDKVLAGGEEDAQGDVAEKEALRGHRERKGKRESV